MKKRIIKSLLSLLLVVFCALTFSNCTKKLENLSYELENGEIKITAYKDKTTVSEVTIPDEIDGYPVTVIDRFGVMNAETLKIIVIGKNVREIGDWAFSGNSALEEFKVDPENEDFTAVDGVLYTKDMKTLVYVPAAKEFENGIFTVPDTVETIRTKSFYGCKLIKKIVVSDSVTDIQEKVFHKCTSLEEVEISHNSNLNHIGKDAFAYCTELKNITLPASLREIDEYAFYNCTKLLEINMHSEESEMTLAKKWYPTNNGQEIKELVINWK